MHSEKCIYTLLLEVVNLLSNCVFCLLAQRQETNAEMTKLNMFQLCLWWIAKLSAVTVKWGTMLTSKMSAWKRQWKNLTQQSNIKRNVKSIQCELQKAEPSKRSFELPGEWASDKSSIWAKFNPNKNYIIRMNKFISIILFRHGSYQQCLKLDESTQHNTTQSINSMCTYKSFACHHKCAFA